MKVQRGLTLIELIIIVIVAIVLSLSASLLWPTNFAINVQAEAVRVANDIRYVQSLAKTTRKKCRFNYTATPSSYYNFEIYSGGSWQKEYYKPIVSLNKDITLGAGIYFLSGGSIEFDGTMTPNTDAVITIQMKGTQRQIVVKKATGRIYVQ